jgi:hypothetical protein
MTVYEIIAITEVSAWHFLYFDLTALYSEVDDFWYAEVGCKSLSYVL